jgi:hypothetical protein
MVVPETGDEHWCQVQRCYAIFPVLSYQSLRDLYFNLYDTNETRITMQKKRTNLGVLSQAHRAENGRRGPQSRKLKGRQVAVQRNSTVSCSNRKLVRLRHAFDAMMR